MSRYTGPSCRICRGKGKKLFLKAERCYTPRCALERRSYAPGQHGKTRRPSRSDYGIQQASKQEVKYVYGLNERVLRHAFDNASHDEGVTGTNFLCRLELRLDNVVSRSGLAGSHNQARQFVSHGLVLVNGKRVDKPGYEVAVGDVVEVVAKMKKHQSVLSSMEAASSRFVPAWLTLDKDNASAKVGSRPTRDQMPAEFNEQNIVEFLKR